MTTLRGNIRRAQRPAADDESAARRHRQRHGRGARRRGGPRPRRRRTGSTITMFGDEPYGNYNRILLSNVLAGADDRREIFLNPLDWYAENGVTCTPASGSPGSTARPRRPRRRRQSCRTTGSSSPRAAVPSCRRSRACGPTTGRCSPACSSSARLDDCAAHDRLRAQGPASKAAVIGGGLLGLEAARGLQNQAGGARRAAGPPDGGAARPTGGAILRHGRSRTSGITCHTEQGPRRRSSAKTASRGLVFADGTALDCDMVVISAGIRPNVGLARACRPDRGAGHRRRRPLALERRPTTSTPSASARSTAARSTASSPRCGSRRRCSPTTHRHRHRRRLPRLAASRPSSRSPGVDLASMGLQSAGTDDDEFVQFAEPQARRLQEARRPRRQAGRRDPARRPQQGRVPHAGLRPRAAAARGTHLADLRPRHPGAEVGAAETGRRRAGLQLQRRLKGAIVAASTAASKSRRAGDGQDARRHGLRVVQELVSADRRVGRRRRGRGRPVR